MDRMAQANTLVRYVLSLPDFQLVGEMDGQWDHMGAIITDAMLQAGIRYETVVAPRVKRLRERYPEAKTTTGFIRLLDRMGAETVLEWSGTEKLNRIRTVADFFGCEGVETEADLKRWLQAPRNLERLKGMRGIGDKTADYFRILVGLSTSAIDRHLFNFLAGAGIHTADYREAQAIINQAADLLPWDRALFDHSIWEYMSRRAASNKLAPKPCTVAPAPQPPPHASDDEEEIEDDSEPRRFRNDNAGYKQWLDEHPQGYVLNIGMIDAKTPDPDDQVVHRAGCGHVHGAGRDWTGGLSMKVCSPQLAALDAWALKRLHAEPDRCHGCKP